MNKGYFESYSSLTLYVVIIMFFVLAMRIYQLQILKGDDYREAANSNKIRVITLPATRGIIYDRNNVPLVKNKPYYYASLMPETKNIDTEGLANLLGIDEKKLIAKIKKEEAHRFKSIVLKEGLTFKDVAVIEARRSDFPGLMVEPNISRQYVFNNIGSHVIGYLGKMTLKQMQSADYDNITPETLVGQWGAEEFFDKQLRGTTGEKIIEVDALGRQLQLLGQTKPKMGDDITLSIDIRLQEIAERAFNGKSGALLAVDTRSAEVLALVSLPAFDPNDFVFGIDTDKWTALYKDKRHPLINRALQSSYPPGSVFKPLVAIAALEEGIIDAHSGTHCSGVMHYGNYSFGCWKSHGRVGFHRALVESCDVFFYEIGRILGVDRMDKYARLFGLGKSTGLGLRRGVDEKDGTVPSTKWKLKTLKKPWFLGETFNASIGQGYISVTPAQVALMTVMIANEGVIRPLTLRKNGNEDDPMKKLDIRPETFDAVKKAMYGVVNEEGGTGSAARSSIVRISGKTGTAQVIAGRVKSEHQKEKFRDHAWFIAYAPAENPEIAVTVFVEHGGHGGSTAGPIAKEVIEAYIKGKAGK
ncbi:MAG: penicillin-binding protein 2 [Nitrospirae bacterium]|nr:penicillin-binding protein 2 [Nitrospirota bacterium]